ncbi:hypothetical protein CN09_09110 [Rhizobium rhizogenes]|nr:hypothetical protein CN09_09110 [Rhizobium rhizogenes]
MPHAWAAGRDPQGKDSDQMVVVKPAVAAVLVERPLAGSALLPAKALRLLLVSVVPAVQQAQIARVATVPMEPLAAHRA